MTFRREHIEIHGIVNDKWASGWLWSAALMMASFAGVYLISLLGE